jgi:hypothetical protein
MPNFSANQRIRVSVQVLIHVSTGHLGEDQNMAASPSLRDHTLITRSRPTMFHLPVTRPPSTT